MTNNKTLDELMETVTAAAMLLDCPACAAKADIQCMTRSGKRRKPHGQRMTDGMSSIGLVKQDGMITTANGGSNED